MDVFGAALEARGFLCDAAIAAGHELGVFDALARGALALDAVADAIGVARGRHRLRALLDVLAAVGAIGRRETDGGLPGFALAARPPPRPAVVRAGWGLLAEVIRRDRPLAIAADDDAARRLHHHLARAGAEPARELVASLGATSLLDLGSGAGTYSRAFLAAHSEGRATLVDRGEILALAADWLGPLAGRARLIEGDAATVDAGGGHGAALLANVLHLHGPAMCARLCAAAARAVAPGGLVAIKDLRVDEDRAGPLEGLLFALNMALYTEAGDVYATAQLRAWLAEAGLIDIEVRRLAAAPDAVAVIGRRPGAVAPAAGPACAERLGGGPARAPGEAAIAVELDAALARTAADAWRELVARGAVRADAAGAPPALAFPSALRGCLAAAVAVERAAGSAGAERAAALVRHYTESMPRMRVAQLASSDGPGSALFHAALDWRRLPRLGAAIERLFAVLADAGVDASAALGATTADDFFARSPTLAALYRRTHYGGAMPLLYGSPADLACAHARGVADGLDAVATIDRYLTAPVVHELCHFAPERTAIAPLHLDECIAGWLGVYVHPELAYPTGDHDDALYAAPWLAQVGQAIARAFGVGPLVRCHTGGVPALPSAFLAAAARLGWDDWRARRTLHLLSDTFDPEPWVALALLCGAGHSPAGQTLATLRQVPLAALALPPDPAFDRAIVEDGLRAMCLSSRQVAGSFRTRRCLPDGPIALDAGACAIVAPGRRALDPVAPRTWLPPAIAARLTGRGISGYALHLGDLDAIADAAAAICDSCPEVERAGFALVPRAAAAV